MPKSSKSLTCTASGALDDGKPWRCGEKYAPGTGGDGSNCPGHYKQHQREPDRALRPLGYRVSRGDLVTVRFQISKLGRKTLAARAEKQGISVNELLRRLVLQ